MKTSSDPREWYRQEEMARYRAVRRKSRGSIRGSHLAPMYILAGAIGTGALYLLAVALGFELPY